MKIRRPAVVAITVVAGLAVLSNLSYLRQARDSYLHTTELERAGLGAVEIARDTVEPGFLLKPELIETAFVYVEAGRYLEVSDAYGSPAYSPEELATAPEYARLAADRALGAALRLTFTPGDEMPAGDEMPFVAGQAPQPVAPTTARTDGACVRVEPSEGAPAVLDLAPGGAEFETFGAGETTVSARRFATASFPITAGTMSGPDTATLTIPTDRSERPWQIGLVGSQPVRVCGTAPG